MKAHKSKQMERRALFLSKVNAPPSPTATALPKTPPESPAILHYTLPSPGLDSPLALFESLQQTVGPVQFPSVKPWVEQVHYRQLNGACMRPPSLEQITARLSSHGHSATVNTAKDEYHRPPIRLPTFLRSPPRMRRAISQHYVGSGEGTDDEQNPEAEITPGPGELIIPLPKTRTVPSLSGPGLLVTTTTISGTSSSSSSALTEVNLSALNSRALTRRDMMSKLKRRVSGLPSADGVGGYGVDEDERRARRISAPAELPKRERDGFAHLVLALPGAF